MLNSLRPCVNGKYVYLEKLPHHQDLRRCEPQSRPCRENKILDLPPCKALVDIIYINKNQPTNDSRWPESDWEGCRARSSELQQGKPISLHLLSSKKNRGCLVTKVSKNYFPTTIQFCHTPARYLKVWYKICSFVFTKFVCPNLSITWVIKYPTKYALST